MKSACTLFVTAALAALCACQTPPPPAPVEYVLAPPTPSLPEPPALIPLPKDKALAALVLEEAAAFRQAMLASGGISANFADGAQVAASVRAGAAFEPRQLQRGAVALVAVTALSQPDFVDTFLPYSMDDAGRAQLARMI